MATVRVYVQEGVTYEVTTRPAEPPPVVIPPPAASNFVQLTDAQMFSGDIDGPTWEYANRALHVPWQRHGGDWRDATDAAYGSAHYASSSHTAVGNWELQVGDLVARLLTRNTGIYLSADADCTFASRSNAMAQGPRLRVVTDVGTFNPPCVVDTWTHPSAGLPMGGTETFKPAALLKFDLSGVTGVVQSATLAVNAIAIYAPSVTVTADYLDMPSLDPGGTPRDGIAATVAKDSELAAHPAVLLYDDIAGPDYVVANFQGVGGSTGGVLNVEAIRWPQYGLAAARVWSATTNQKIVGWHHWAEPKQNPPKTWQRDFGNGHTHLFCRYLLEIGEDVKEGMTEGGMKLPGMTGTYDWSTSGAVTLPEPAADGTWEMRLWHTGVAHSHPDIYHLATYYYGVEAPLSKYAGQGDPRGPRFTKAYLKAGRIYSIEQEVKLNTLDANGKPNSDGIERVWVDGVLAYENTSFAIRGYDNVRIQSIPFVNIYHGGMGMPSKTFHYDIGGICVATEYIGPPKLVLGEPPVVVQPPEPPPIIVPPPTPPSESSSLAQFIAAMAPGIWAQFQSNNISAVIESATQTGNHLPYSGLMPWNPQKRELIVHGADHGAGNSRVMHYRDSDNAWQLLGLAQGNMTHGYQGVAVNPYTGDIYAQNALTPQFYRCVGAGVAASQSDWPLGPKALGSWGSEIAPCICWWSGPDSSGVGTGEGMLVVHHSSNGQLHYWNPLQNSTRPQHQTSTDGSKWVIQGGILTATAGMYQRVMAYSEKHSCLVVGGGGASGGAQNNEMVRISADLSVTPTPTAPVHPGIYSGSQFVCDPVSGNFLLIGFGVVWELDPTGAMKWTKLGTMPAGMYEPTVAQTIVSSCDNYGAVILIAASRGKPTQMWVYRHA